MLTTAYFILKGALSRDESRGVHFRSDHPEDRDEWRHHQAISLSVDDEASRASRQEVGPRDPEQELRDDNRHE
jgi:L-aspartate oxidase